jgi:hypothetical protein
MEFEIDNNFDNDIEFKLPNKKINVIDDNILFNKSKISNEILSMGSASSDNSSSISYQDSNDIINNNKISYNDDDDIDDSDIDDNNSIYSNKIKNINNNQNQKFYNKRDENLEKKEILYQFDRLKSKGVKVPYDFNMNSDINEMRNSYERIKREKSIDSSIRFQRKMMMGFVTGFEFLNNRYDPFSIELDGWSEQVHETIDDYDDIFEELHEKYKETGSDMAPELRLLISLGGSAFMFHLTKRMFSNTKLPKVEEVLQKNPDLMKKFQEASAMEYMNGYRPQSQDTRQTNPTTSSGDIFSMVSGLFGNDNTNTNTNNNTNNDIDNIINNVHSQININPKNDDNMMETLTVTDDEITSLIEDSIDITLSNQKKNNKKTKKNNDKRVLTL